MAATGAAVAALAVTSPALYDKIEKDALNPLKTFLAKSDGRDKLGRLVQYVLKMVIGYVSEMEPNEGRKKLATIMKKMMGNISDARRTNRWFKEISPLAALRACFAKPEASWARWSLSVVANTALIGYNTLDHLNWMEKMGVFTVDKNTSMRSARLLTLGHFCQMWYQLMKAAGTPEGQRLLGAKGQASTSKDAGKEWGDTKQEAFKQWALFMQAAHAAQVKPFESSDLFVGFLGTVTGLMDVYKLWPASK